MATIEAETINPALGTAPKGSLKPLPGFGTQIGGGASLLNNYLIDRRATGNEHTNTHQARHLQKGH